MPFPHHLDHAVAGEMCAEEFQCFCWIAEDWLHRVALPRRRELEVARAMRRRGVEPAFEHESRESLGLHAVAGAVVICFCVRGALRDQDPEQDEPWQ